MNIYLQFYDPGDALRVLEPDYQFYGPELLSEPQRLSERALRRCEMQLALKGND